MTQPELPLYRNFTARARKGPQLARRMIAALKINGGWMTRADFACFCGLTDRECRLGRAAAHGRIIQGQRGYKLNEAATDDERAACLGNFAAQIKALQEEYRQVCLRAHRAVHVGRAAMG